MIARGPFVAALFAALPAAVAKPPPPEADALSRAAADEIARLRGLRVASLDAPYYLAASVDDTDSFDVVASFGALEMSNDDSRRSLHTDVRAGSPKLDNENFLDQDPMAMFERMMQGSFGGPVPVGADYDALRQALWLRFDDSYKTAVETLARKRGYLETNAVDDRPDDFSAATESTLFQPMAKLEVDRARWTRLVEETSRVFRGLPHVTLATASLRAEAVNQTFVSSDPARSRFGETSLDFAIIARAQAPEGSEVELRYAVSGRTEAELPKDAELVKAANELARRLAALAAAPKLDEDYSGPVLFTGPAAGRFFLSAVGEPLSHPRDPLGAPATGRLTDRIGRPVASPLLTVKDDPTKRSWKGQPLLGAFPVDDEGVASQPVTLIDKGVLKSCYMSRVPTRHFTKTNGHARGEGASVGNLLVEGAKAKSRAALEKQLVDLAKAEGLDYALEVEEGADDRGGTDFPFQRSPGGDLRLFRPALVWRVHQDGRRELVRGAAFAPASFRLLDDIVALGTDPTVLDTEAFGQSVSVVAPSVLVRRLDVTRPGRESEKPPALSRPLVGTTP